MHDSFILLVSVRSSAAPLAQGGRRLRGPKRIKKWTWMRLWLIILIDSRNSFGVGPRDQKLLLHVTPGRDKKWHSKPSLGMSWTNGHLGLYVWSKRILYRRSTLNSFRLLHHQLF
ncbi:unnamed protein product [Musa acuminata subsp. malaccensis]|uniref:(wild Malaysian banana) hypothetical protein n=1 Tax=Musa acuminata subsp. malaccensis TaxID=214687 RepID=A0A8D6ZRY3_MUSAM|nr:unnamed protein product [Musa acuminata subsp. malaccensis]